MQVVLENNYVTSFAVKGNLFNGVEVAEPEDMDNFWEHFYAYKLVDNNLVFDENKLIELDRERMLENIRQRRETECFPVINRGQLWYSMLTVEQLNELQEWYQAWLNAPQTLIIPEDLDWIQRGEY